MNEIEMLDASIYLSIVYLRWGLSGGRVDAVQYIHTYIYIYMSVYCHVIL